MCYVCIRTADEFDQLEALEKNVAILVELIPDPSQTEQVRNALAQG